MNISNSVTNRALSLPNPASLTDTPRPDPPGKAPASLTELAGNVLNGQSAKGAALRPAALTDIAAKQKLSPDTFVEAAQTRQTTGGPLVFDPAAGSVTGNINKLTDLAAARSGQLGIPVPGEIEAAPEKLTEDKIAEITSNLTLDGVARELEPFFNEIAEKAVKNAINSHDLNSDGTLTHEELNISFERFSKIDGDRDGRITVDELTSSLKSALGKAMRIDPAVDPSSFAEQWFKSLDIDGNQSLTQLEAPLPDSLFDRADENADGELSFTEVKHAMEDRTPAIDRRQRLEDIALSITRQLDEAGFTDRPPTNIRSLVDGLNLDQFSSKFLLQMLSTRYPHGLGISLFG